MSQTSNPLVTVNYDGINEVNWFMNGVLLKQKPLENTRNNVEHVSLPAEHLEMYNHMSHKAKQLYCLN